MYATETVQNFCHVTSVVLTGCILLQHRQGLNLYTVAQKTYRCKLMNLNLQPAVMHSGYIL